MVSAGQPYNKLTPVHRSAPVLGIVLGIVLAVVLGIVLVLFS